MSGKEAFEFIRMSISHQPEAVRRQRAQAFLEAGGDWNVVRREAARHGILPLFDHHLDVLLGDRLPATLRDRIQEFRRVVQIQNTFLAQELGNVFRVFKESNVPILALKGPVLAKVAYGDVAMRRYVDLDVVIPKEQFSEARELLRAIGYKCRNDKKNLTGWRRKVELYFTGQWPFVKGEGTFSLDVHTRILPRKFSFPVEFSSFWERSRSVHLEDDHTVRGFSQEDMVLILAYHGMKNQWRALKHVTDLAGLIYAAPGLDWEVLLSRARSMRATRVLALGLFMTQEMMRLSLPSEVKQWIQGRDIDDTAEMMVDYLQNRDNSSESVFGRRVESFWHRADLRLQLDVKDTATAQGRYIAYTIIQLVWSALLKP